MPSVPLYFELTTRVFQKTAGGSTVTLFTAKLGDRRKYVLSALEDGIAQDLPTGTVVKLGLKDPAALDATLETPPPFLATAIGTRQGSGTGSRWIFDLAFNSSELLARIAKSTIPVQLAFEAEFTFPDLQIISSQPVPCAVENQVIVGTEDEIEAPTTVVALLYLADVTGETGGGVDNLDGKPIATYAALTTFLVFTATGASLWRKQLDSTVADVVTDLDVGVIVPVDYDAGTMPYVLVRGMGV